MCGICGFTLPDPRVQIHETRLTPMLSALSHRGPDGQGRHVTPAVALGHVRLAIIDLAGGDQHMTGPGGVTLVFNGEIYNYKEIRRDLETKGVRFRTSSDTEVLLMAYLELGEACLESMVGMFAFSIYDPRRNKLIMGRDRLGKKPLYYWQGLEGLAFASEIKALLPLPWVRRDLDIDPLAVRDYLSLGYILDPKSIFSSIRKLSPGTLGVYDLGDRKLSIRRWWDARSSFQAPKLPWSAQTVERFDELLTDAASLRLRSDVPLGLFVSGGLDSSSIAACLKRAGADVKLFCARFEQESYDESPYAQKVADHLGFELTCAVQPMPRPEDLSRIVWHLDEPFCDTSIIPTFNICETARSFAKVILGGDGADELLAGYVTHRADRLKRLTDLAPDFALRLLRAAAGKILRPSYKKLSMDYKVMQFLKGAALPAPRAHYFWRTIFDDQDAQAMLDPDFALSARGYDPYENFAKAFAAVPEQSFLDQSLYVDMTTWLPDDILVKCDRMSMANSLELRSPFLDHRLVELAARLPAPAKMRGFEQKVILKKCMASHLPASILARPKKGFNFPAYCITNPVLATPEGTGVFRKGFKLEPTREDVTYKSFNLLIFSTWHAIYEQFRSTGRWEPLPRQA